MTQSIDYQASAQERNHRTKLLHAAAPDLLQALTWLACEADEDMPSEYRTDSFRAALDAAWDAVAKAEGEPA